jgi:hypothetical protein
MEGLMAETSGSAAERLRDLVSAQVDGYRRLLDSTREGSRALRTQDMESFDRILGDQVETLRELKVLERARDRMIQEVGPASENTEFRRLQDDLRRLAHEVSRATRVSRLVIERNGAMVEARLALHHRARNVTPGSGPGIDRIA